MHLWQKSTFMCDKIKKEKKKLSNGGIHFIFSGIISGDNEFVLIFSIFQAVTSVTSFAALDYGYICFYRVSLSIGIIKVKRAKSRVRFVIHRREKAS